MTKKIHNWKEIEELRAGQPKPSSEPIRTNELLWISGVLCQRVVMNGGGGNRFWVRIQGEAPNFGEH